MAKPCFNCGKTTTEMMQGYSICDSCKSTLRLFSDETIMKYHSKNPIGFSKEIERRLDCIEKDYIKKKIKLLYVKEQLHKFNKRIQ